MQIHTRTSPIVAFILLASGGAILSGCGQSGSLYLPTVPPLPAPLNPPLKTQPSTPSSSPVSKGDNIVLVPPSAVILDDTRANQ